MYSWWLSIPFLDLFPSPVKHPGGAGNKFQKHHKPFLLPSTMPFPPHLVYIKPIKVLPTRQQISVSATASKAFHFFPSLYISLFPSHPNFNAMHPIPLLTSLILPLSILAAPTPADPIVPVEARYSITQASVRYQRDARHGFINKDFDFSIRGTKDGDVDIHCAGGVDVRDKVEHVKMNCPLDPRLEVWVSAGLESTFDMTVQFLSVVPFSPLNFPFSFSILR